jgi:exportin-1
MAKPKEVLVVIDENGDAAEEQFNNDADAIHIYDLMRESLVFLTNIDSKSMDKTI